MNRSLPTLLACSLGAAILPAPPARADFTVSGVLQYRDREFDYDGFTGAQPALPVRFANVEVLNTASDQVLAAGITEANGSFSLSVTGSGSANLRVRCLSRSRPYGEFRILVVDGSDSLYTLESPDYLGWNLDTDLDVGTIVSEIDIVSNQLGNPFNVLDAGVIAMEYIRAQGTPVLLDDVTVEWPSSPTATQLSTVTLRFRDAYDDTLILRQLGHVFERMYSYRSYDANPDLDNNDQPPYFAFSAAWCTCFAAAVRQFDGASEPGLFLDTYGSPVIGPNNVRNRLRLEDGAPYVGAIGGEASESAIACALWDLVDTAATDDGDTVDDDPFDGSYPFAGGVDGDKMCWDIVAGPLNVNASQNVNDFWNALFSPVEYGAYPDFLSVFDAFEIRNSIDPEEPNNDFASATPIALGLGWGPIRTLYYSAADPPAPGDHDVDTFEFFLNQGDRFNVETRYPNGAPDARTYADTRIQLCTPSGACLLGEGSGGVGRNAALFDQTATETGEWRLQVYADLGSIPRETGSYQVRVTHVGASIESVTPPVVEALVPGGQPLTLSGYGFTNTTSVEIDGIVLTPGAYPLGEYEVLNDTTIAVHAVPLLSQTGLVDVVVTSQTAFAGAPTAIATAQLQVDPVPTPVLSVLSPNVVQAVGFEMTAASGLLDVVWVNVSTSMVPTVLPGFLSLSIGNNGTELATPWKPVIGAKGWRKRSFGPFSGLAGFTFYWQAFALQAVDGYLAPWPASNVVQTTILF